MTAYLSDPDFTLYNGDSLEVLRELPGESVHMCVTSPPFFGLRDYGTGTWEGGDAECDHVERPNAMSSASTLDGGKQDAVAGVPFKVDCRKCGARRIDRQIGLESTDDLYGHLDVTDMAVDLALIEEAGRV